MTDDQVSDEIIRRLREQVRTRFDSRRCMPAFQAATCPTNGRPGWVILGPDFPHANRDDKSPARREAAANSRLTWRISPQLPEYAGIPCRRCQPPARVGASRPAVAWRSIWDDRVTLNLDQFQTRQAETNAGWTRQSTFASPKPTRPARAGPARSRGRSGLDRPEASGPGELATGCQKLKNEESLVTQMGGVRLRTELPNSALGPEITSVSSISQSTWPVTSTFPGWRDEQVLLAAIQEGVASLMWQGETFAYAELGTNSASYTRACVPHSPPASSSMTGACSSSSTRACGSV